MLACGSVRHGINDRTSFTTFFVTRDQKEAMELASLVDDMSMGIERSGSPDAIRFPRPAFMRDFVLHRAAPFGAGSTHRPATMASFLPGARRKLVDEDWPFMMEINREVLWQTIGNAEPDPDLTLLARQDFVLRRRRRDAMLRTSDPARPRGSTWSAHTSRSPGAECGTATSL
jgi:hypothetical protein